MKHFITTSIVSALMLIMFSNLGWGQVNISSGSSITESFTIGNTATATLPSGWKVDKNTSARTVGTYIGSVSATEQYAGNNMSSSATNGIYNYGAGVYNTATDRSIGWMSSGSATKSGNLYVSLNNSGSTTITNFLISYDVEKYRNGSNTAGYSIQLYYSTDGSTWTSAGSNFLTSFSADADNNGYASAPGSTVSISNKNLAISVASGSKLYLAWNFSVTTGTTTSNAQGLGIDNVSITAVAPPTTQASEISFTGVGQNGMTVNWTNGNGAKRVVIINTSNSFTSPTDGTDPNANNNYSGSGEQIVYNNSNNSVSITGLSAGTIYWFRVFEYNGTGTGTKFITSTANNNPNSQSTSSASTPTITVISSITDFGNITVNTNSTVQSYTVSGSNLTENIVITPPAGFQISTTNSPFTPTNPITLTQTGGTVNSTTIYVMFSPTTVSAYSNSITHTSSGSGNPSLTVSGTGVSPSDPATFTANSTNQTEISLTATSNVNNNSIVVVFNGTGTFSAPTDGVAPGNVGDPFANGTIVYKGDATSLDKHTGLTPGTIYFYKAFSYDAYNFYSAGATAKDTTLKYAPTVQASNITFTSIGNTSMTINWTNGDGDRRIVIINTVNSFTNPVDGIVPSSTSTSYSGSGEQTIYYYSSNSVTVTGLTPGTQYWFRVFEVNNSSSNALYLTTSTTNNPNSQFTNTPASFLEDFETGTKAAYAIGNVSCTMGSWSLNDAVIGTSASDRKNGSQSVRLRDGDITMNFNVTNGAREVTVYHGKYGTDANKTWKLQKSTDNGTSWTDVGPEITTSSTTLTAQVFTVKQPGTVRFRILSTSSTSAIRVNIDDIAITDYDKTVTTTSSLPDTEYGNLTINGSGINVTLSGSTVLNGNLNLTNGSLVIGSNTLTLNGGATGTGTLTGSASSNLIIGGTGDMGTIYFTSGSEVLGNLTMNRTSSGSVTFGSNLNVNTGLTLTSGIINMGANTLTLGTSILSFGTLTIADISSNASYITGNFERWMPAGLSGDVYFPVGTTNAYRPAIINYTNNKSSGGKLKVSGNDTDPGTVNPSASLLDDAYTVDRYSKQAWWKFTTSTITGGMYDISLGAFAIDGVSQPNFGLLRLMKRADNTSNWSFSGTHSDATGTYSLPFVKRTGISNGFSEFGIGGYSVDGNTLSNAPLPVHLSSFTSSANRRNITLNWSTASENNNSGFDIERKSVDGNNWVKAGFVTGSGTTANASSYSFTDRNLNSGKYKYRLKQIDYNGNYEYFELNGTPEVGVPDKYNISQNYPNPFNPTTKIDLDIPFDSKVSLVLYDMAGREVRSLIGNEMKAGYYTHLLDASSLSSGVYFYRVVMNSGKASFVQSKKMVLLK